MNFTTSIEEFKYQNSWISIGTFDGVHLGHRSLIGQMVKKAHESGEPALVITFWPHPAVFFHRAPLANALSSPEERSALIKQLGVDEVLTLNFDQSLADLEARSFMQQLNKKLALRHLFVGPNFAMGRGRTGNLDRLKEIGSQLEISIEVADTYLTHQGTMISSSRIREDLRQNRIREANEKLGRAYSINGMVVHGEHRGTKMGIPTANMNISPDRLLPGNGVYITRAWVDGKPYPSVTNIGIRPTFENPLLVPRIEPHILDLDEQLYDHQLTLEFIDFLRPEVRFESPQGLIAQIQKDIAITRKVFSDED